MEENFINLDSDTGSRLNFDEVEITFPNSTFGPIKIGEFRGVSHLEKIIDILGIKSNKYIIHSKATLLDNESLENCTLLLANDLFYFIPKEELPETFSVYSFMEIESVEEDKANSLILISFYKTEKSDKIPPIVLKIRIEEDIDQDKLFKFSVMFKRQQQQCWQRYLEDKMDMRPPEYYQHHAYAFKVADKDKFEPRFIVISNIFIYNVKMKSENSRLNRRVFSFNERLWYHPIEALVKIQLQPTISDKVPYILSMFFDLELQNKILVNLSKKKQK